MQHLRFCTASVDEVSERKREAERKSYSYRTLKISFLILVRPPSTRKILYGVGGNSPEIHENAVVDITVTQSVDAVSVCGGRAKIPTTFTVDVLSQSSVPA
eukprot:4435286-Amphidinium_carterae.2